MRTPSLLIVEPGAAGHRAVWVRWMTRQMMSRGWRIVIATSGRALQEDAFSWLAGRQDGIQIVSSNARLREERVDGNAGLLIGELQRHRLIGDLYRRARDDHEFDVVLLPFGDYVVHATALLGSPFGVTPWVTVVMRPTFHHPIVGVKTPVPSHSGVRRALFHRFLRAHQLTGCLTVDESLYQYTRALSKLSSKVDFLPDPASPPSPLDRREARRSFGIPPDAVTVLVFGGLSERKGLRFLTSAMRTLGRGDVHALLVGVADSAARAWLNSGDASALRESGRLHVVDRWVDEQTEAAAFAAADIAWLGYIGHWRSSGVLVQAALSGLPVVACDQGVIGWLTLRHQCGLVVPVQQVQAVSAALGCLASSPELRRQLGDRGKEAFALHTVENAGVVLSKTLDRAFASSAGVRG